MLPDASDRPLLTIDEYVEATGGTIHRRSAAYAAVERGELPAIRIGRRWFLKTAELHRLFGLDSPPAS